MTTYAKPSARARRRPTPPPERPKKKRDPLWAKLLLIFGSLVMVASGALVVLPSVLADWFTKDIPQAPLIPQELLGKNIDGQINLLLLGLDERASNTAPPLADSIIIVHIPATHDRIFMISLPRDLEVEIPAYPLRHVAAHTDKLNAAFALAARNEEGRRDDSPDGRIRGMNLTMQTINQLVPGGIQFNGAAIINFQGFQNVLKVIGGVDMCVDTETRSVHYDKDNKYVANDLDPGIPSQRARMKVYKVGCQHLEYWEALDFARQRKSVADQGGDYTRQRHQQQLLLAIFKKLTSKGTLTDISKIGQLQKAAGDLLTLDMGQTKVIDWVFTLGKLGSDNMVMIRTNGDRIAKNNVGFVDTPGGRQGLTEGSKQLLQALHDDNLLSFLGQNPDFVSKVPTS